VSDEISQRQLDDRVLQLKGLVLVRALLESRGASDAEVAAHSDEIARLRGELELVNDPEGERAAA
jgi:hypothetical protein